MAFGGLYHSKGRIRGYRQIVKELGCVITLYDETVIHFYEVGRPGMR